MERTEGTECSSEGVGDEEVATAYYKSDYTPNTTVLDDIDLTLVRLDTISAKALWKHFLMFTDPSRRPSGDDFPSDQETINNNYCALLGLISCSTDTNTQQDISNGLNPFEGPIAQRLKRQRASCQNGFALIWHRFEINVRWHGDDRNAVNNTGRMCWCLLLKRHGTHMQAENRIAVKITNKRTPTFEWSDKQVCSNFAPRMYIKQATLFIAIDLSYMWEYFNAILTSAMKILTSVNEWRQPNGFY